MILWQPTLHLCSADVSVQLLDEKLSTDAQLKINNKTASVCAIVIKNTEATNPEVPVTETSDFPWLPKDESNEIKALLRKHREAISQNSMDTGKYELVEHHINTRNHPLIAATLPHATFREQCDQMLQMVAIWRYASLWQSPTLNFRKLDNTFKFS